MKEYKFKINGKDYAVQIGEADGKNLTVNVNGADYQVELEQKWVQSLKERYPVKINESVLDKVRDMYQ